MKKTLFLLFMAAALAGVTASRACAEKYSVVIFDFASKSGESDAWAGLCLADYAVQAVNGVPGLSAPTRAEVKRRLEQMGIGDSTRARFEQQSSVQASLDARTMIEGSFSLERGSFSFQGTAVDGKSGDVKDISFSLKQFSLEKAQTMLAQRIVSALGKKLKDAPAKFRKTGSVKAYTNHWRAERLAETGVRDRAAQLLDTAIAADKSYIEPRLLQANLLLEGTLFSQAIGKLEQCLKIQPKNPEIIYRLGLAHFLSHNNTEARKYLKAAADAAPDNPEYRWQLGVFYKSAFQPDKALEELNEAVSLAPDMAQAWYELASIYALAGKTDKALDCIEKVLSTGRQTYLNKVRNDSDFDGLRDTKRYREIIRRAQ